MFKVFCDYCVQEIKVGEEPVLMGHLELGGLKIALQLVVGIDHDADGFTTWNAGHICRPCLRAAVSMWLESQALPKEATDV